MRHHMILVVLLALLAMACGVAITGRIDVGEEQPRTPCPQGTTE